MSEDGYSAANCFLSRHRKIFVMSVQKRSSMKRKEEKEKGEEKEKQKESLHPSAGFCYVLCPQDKAEVASEKILLQELCYLIHCQEPILPDVSDHKKLFLNLQMSSVLQKWVNSTN
ncbi:hypothetical protein BTVI_41170 [Pitangus sulphuratus]|nr:hypothetical protein BTVI_41170 [Pitangus sulphuratus]